MGNTLTGHLALPAFWAEQRFRLFLSHCASQKMEVAALRTRLVLLGISPFVAHQDVEPTKEWQSEIERGLSTMEALVAVLSTDFSSSFWCDQEVGFAFGRSQLVIPIRFPIDPYGFLGKFQALTVPGTKLVSVADSVVKVLIADARTSASVTNSIINAFSNSRSFEQAKTLSIFVEQLPALSRAQAEIIAEGLTENNQVYDAHQVPDRVRNVLKRSGFDDLAA